MGLHRPVSEQYQKLKQELQGHDGYYGIIENYSSLYRLWGGARRIWRRRLSRRRRGKRMSWPEYKRRENRYDLPRARVVHGLTSSVAKS
jgi:hypothetical protein